VTGTDTLNSEPMKFSAISLEPAAIRKEDAARFVGLSEDTLELCIKVGWIKPAVQGNRMCLFDVQELRLLWNRIKRDGLPKDPKKTPENEN
jgi:hypothetical protein